MSILNTYYLLFKTDVQQTAKKDIEGLDKQIDQLRAKGRKRSEEETHQLKESQKQRKILSEQVKDQQKDVEKLGDSFVKVVENSVAAATAVFTFSGIKSGIADAAKLNSALQVQGKITGQNVTQMRTYAAAVESAGGSAESFYSTLQSTFQKAAESRIALPSVDVLMQRYHDAIKGLSKNEQAFRLGQLGVTDPGMIALLEQSDAEFAKSIEQAREHSKVTQEDADAAREFESQWSKTSQSLGQAFTHLGTDIFPLIQPGLKSFSEFLDGLRQHTGATEAFFAAMAAGTWILTKALTAQILAWVGVGRAAAGAATAEAAAAGAATAEAAAAGAATAEAAAAGAGGIGLAGFLGLGAGAYEIGSGIRDVATGNHQSFLGQGADWLADKIVSGSEWIKGTNRTPKARAGSPIGNSSLKQQSLNFWTSQGYTPAQAAGIVANEQAESNFNPSAVGDSGLAKGSFQWHADRRAKILAGTGIDVTTASHDDQLRAAQWELTQSGLSDRLKQAGSAEEAAALFSLRFERPAGGYAEASRRAQIAAGIANEHMNAATTAAGALSSGGVTEAGSSSTSSVSVKIDKIEVQTQAMDADGIAKAIAPALESHINLAISNLDDGMSA